MAILTFGLEYIDTLLNAIKINHEIIMNNIKVNFCLLSITNTPSPSYFFENKGVFFSWFYAYFRLGKS